jgi:hypothetical protein
VRIRRIAATIAAATLTLTLAPTATAVAAEQSLPDPAATVTSAKPILPDEDTHPALERRKTTTAALYAQAGLTPPKSLRTNASSTAAASAASSATPALPPGLRDHVNQSCTGTGTDGSRVQVMYVREADQPDRYASVAPVLRNEMRYIDDAFALSSMETGSGRRVRWVTDSACNLNVLNVVLPDGAITGPHSKTENALNAAGYLKSNRKYLAFADVAMGGLGGDACGQGTMYADSRPTNNLNDGRYPQMARIDLECWVTDAQYNATPLHEFLHTLGAVQSDAPHTDGGAHCTDESEVMCYDDGNPNTQVCAATQKFDIDCNNDDYFHTNPPAGSYLATHWNTANSTFLDTVPALPAPPSISVTADTQYPTAGEVVTFTAAVPAGTSVDWSSNIPQCENTGAPTTGSTFTLRCFSATPITVTATARNSGYTTRTTTASVEFQPAPAPSLEVSGPTSAGANTSFTLTSTLYNGKGTWQYQWANYTPGCTIGNATGTTLTASCNTTVQGNAATFGLTVTRREDGREEMRTVNVQITAAGAPTLTISGDKNVVAGQTARFSAQVTNTSGAVTYAWSSQKGWGSGPANTSAYATAVPSNASSGSDIITLTVTSGGHTVTSQWTYTVEGALAITMYAPTTMETGSTVLITAVPTKAATLQFTDDQAACDIVRDSIDPSAARLTCGGGYSGQVVVYVHASTGSQFASASHAITVMAPPAPPTPPTPPTQAGATSLSMTVSTGAATRFSLALRDTAGGAVPGREVRLERSTGGAYSLVKMIPLDNGGNATFDMAVTSKGNYRAVFSGDSRFKGSSSTEKTIYVWTKIAAKKVKGGVKGQLLTGSNSGVGGQKLIVEKKVKGSKAWKYHTTVKTNSKGVVTVKNNPKKATDFRFRFKGNTTYLACISPSVRLK